MLVSFANHSTAPVNLGGAERSLLRFVEDWAATDPDFTPHFVTKAPRGKFIEALDERGWQYDAFRYRGWAVPSPQPAPAAERAAFATVDYAAVSAIIRHYERQRPDLVVTNTLVAPWASFAAAVLGIPPGLVRPRVRRPRPRSALPDRTGRDPRRHRPARRRGRDELRRHA
ncbi:hypothetical protein [Curtobacterium sp. MCPF17_052]|uniref:hypothetical protein n=1 Tax=Curtobacterium sp. MCPF17_052 TaxID=2175655 RepID=UPI0024DF7011|nr:hypothetical protein [Curtobacterium sp. MCPF17_052]WIB12405.1 hypothetical protein DEJ36_17305 [Curtobacterium sp. MCPF17_052]